MVLVLDGYVTVGDIESRNRNETVKKWLRESFNSNFLLLKHFKVNGENKIPYNLEFWTLQKLLN